MTDYTGSVHVNKFIARGEDASVLGKIKEGMYVTVRGKPDFDKFYGDMVIEPYVHLRGGAENEARFGGW